MEGVNIDTFQTAGPNGDGCETRSRYMNADACKTMRTEVTGQSTTTVNDMVVAKHTNIKQRTSGVSGGRNRLKDRIVGQKFGEATASWITRGFQQVAVQVTADHNLGAGKVDEDALELRLQVVEVGV